MTISIARVVYYSFMLITMIVTFTLHLCAVAGENWVEVEAAGRKVHYGLWVSCEDFNCVRFSNTHLKLPEKFIVVQVVMMIACVSCGLCVILLFYALAVLRKIIFRILAFLFLTTAVFDIIAMACFTDLHKVKLKQVSFGWSYYTGWVGMVASVGIGILSILNELFDPVEESARTLFDKETFYRVVRFVNFYFRENFKFRFYNKQ